MQVLNLESGSPFSMGKGKNWSVLNPDVGAEHITLNHAVHSPGHEFTQHLHDDSEDVIIVLEGDVHLRQGDVYTPLSAGEAAFIPAAEVHGTVNRSERDVRMISFQLPPDLALYRGERNIGEGKTPRPEQGAKSAVQIVQMSKGSPVFPAVPAVRNVFSPLKGTKQAVLDFLILQSGQMWQYSNVNPESVIVVIEGKASVASAGTELGLSRFDVLFLKGEQSIAVMQTGAADAVLLCCSAAAPPE